ncbi:hypothetical protein C1M51_18390 [Methylibium sp. Pch-M]|uniref:hypothetical protein n=1 Tax=Methylibium sp. Pch-M TaxID=2082386 RepID=UPI0010114AAF|nr:hypothetical protein [Methylibium sp. Pch-M]QAZ41229.1 hypothetical protein C1M51_18390 [Methylibium sp. Pch-M]
MGPLIGGASGAYGNRLDGSGWSVNFSGTQVATPSKTEVTSDGLPTPAGLVTSGGLSPVMVGGVALLIVGALLLRRRKG